MRRGKLKMANAKGWIEALREFRDGPVRISVQPLEGTRSVEANALYWAGYVAPLSAYTGYSPDEVHEYLKQRFLAAKRIIISDASGVVVDDAPVVPTTTTLTREEFSAFLRSIESFAFDLGVDVGPRVREDAYAK